MSAPTGAVDKHKNRPQNTRFKQQKLPAWQPILTAGTVLPTFFIIGLVFVPIGVGLLMTSNKVKEIVIDYTDCFSVQNGAQMCYQLMNTSSPPSTGPSCRCELTFNIDQEWTGEVHVYYGLANFYQNHRRYVKSRDDRQLMGDLDSYSGDCAPFQVVNDSKSAGKRIIPCGAVANSMFNDTIALFAGTGRSLTPIFIDKKDIAWPTDRSIKFQNPKGSEKCGKDVECWKAAFKASVSTKPPAWRKHIWELDLDDPSNNGFANEAFIIWMRTSALPTFRKLYGRIKQEGAYINKLPQGNYTLAIGYNYPVHVFQGRKRVVLTTLSWLGSKNSFLGVGYIVVGSICVTLGIIFLVIHVKFGKSLVELSNIDNNRNN